MRRRSTMPTRLAAALVLALTTATAASALAQKAAPSFPMPAAEFEEHVAHRLARARARLEKEISDGRLPDSQADGLRAAFNEGASSVGIEVQRAVADGTVTREEAAAVRAAFRQLRKGAPAPDDDGKD
jgi:hypothetical protein